MNVNKIKNQKPCIIWFTGLSGSGKTTTSTVIDKVLTRLGYHTFVLDGDNVRDGLCNDLGFSQVDRDENIRRAGEVAKLMMDAGLIVICSFISPSMISRDLVRSLVSDDEFIEVFMDTPLSTCEDRDVNGLYKKARDGELLDFTGISSPYEVPTSPEITLTSNDKINRSIYHVLDYLRVNSYISVNNTQGAPDVK